MPAPTMMIMEANPAHVLGGCSGVMTNKSFLLNTLTHPEFVNGVVDTSFIANNPQLLVPYHSQNRGNKLLKFVADIIVNGPAKDLGATGPACSVVDPIVPKLAPHPKKDVSNGSLFGSEGGCPLVWNMQSPCAGLYLFFLSLVGCEQKSLRQTYVEGGPKAFARVRFGRSGCRTDKE